MPKKQKRFKSEAAILKAIDEMEAKKVKRLQDAEEWDFSIKTMLLSDFPSEEEYTAEKDYRRKMGFMARRSAQRAESKKAELGKALSAYRTMLLPMPLNDDNSVVL